MNTTKETINPIKITYTTTGEVFTLDFSRETVKFMERKGFIASEISDYIQSRVPEFFFYSFRKNHPNVSRQKTDEILSSWGGMTMEVLTRLIELFNQARFSNVIQDEEDAEKNGVVLVEM